MSISDVSFLADYWLLVALEVLKLENCNLTTRSISKLSAALHSSCPLVKLSIGKHMLDTVCGVCVSGMGGGAGERERFLFIQPHYSVRDCNCAHYLLCAHVYEYIHCSCKCLHICAQLSSYIILISVCVHWNVCLCMCTSITCVPYDIPQFSSRITSCSFNIMIANQNGNQATQGQ